MSLLEVTGLTHSFGENYLFKNADFTLNKGEHIGIVGQNGAGKSTFIKICTEQLIPDSGRIVWQPNTKIGYLDQYAQIEKSVAMREFLQSAFSGLYEIENRMNELYCQSADGDMAKLSTAARYQEELERKEFYLIDTKRRLREYMGTHDKRFLPAMDKALAISIGLNGYSQCPMKQGRLSASLPTHECCPLHDDSVQKKD